MYCQKPVNPLNNSKREIYDGKLKVDVINLFLTTRDLDLYLKQHTSNSQVHPLLLGAVEQVTVVREGEDDPLPVDSLQLDHLLLLLFNLHELYLARIVHVLELL